MQRQPAAQPTRRERVLVTGGSGFIGIHCISQLLAAGYRVRSSLRNTAREADVIAMLQTGSIRTDDALATHRLTFAVADLEHDSGWAEAAANCDYVLHVASPFPLHAPKHENELIRPAREGTLRVLRASRDAGVKRVVLTSSFAAIGYGHDSASRSRDPRRPFDETEWTNPDGPGVSPYSKSKTLAEKAAWDFIAAEGGALELSVINPVVVFGPALGVDYSPSVILIKRMLDGRIPGCPKIVFGAVDVRDVADLHLRAMTHPAANGKRFLALAGNFLSVQAIATILRHRMGKVAERVPTRELANWMVRLAAVFDTSLRQILPELGKSKNATHDRATRLLGWTPRSAEDAIVATAESLVSLGAIKL